MNPIPITTITAVEQERIKTEQPEFDSFLGGGFVDSQCIILAGTPGAGKSTLLLQLSTLLVDTGQRILYFSGEESLGQIKLRANRLGTLRKNILCSETMILEDVYKKIDEVNPKFIIVDSMQMLFSPHSKGEEGSEKQLKYCLLHLINYIKQSKRVLIVIGHANKTGGVAGLLKLQHMVDTVLFLRVKNKERYLESIKNRFGSIDDTLHLVMTQSGFTQFTKQPIVIESTLSLTQPIEHTSTLPQPTGLKGLFFNPLRKRTQLQNYKILAAVAS